jgi:hypothetical protein
MPIRPVAREPARAASARVARPRLEERERAPDLVDRTLMVSVPGGSGGIGQPSGRDEAELITPKQRVTLTRTPTSDFHRIQFHVESPLVSGFGASYKAFFDLRAA